jgi:FkbM family methyltransferase
VAGLVFDIGMHNGDDTAHYLACGYDVVAVDANPALCEAAAERFAAAIEDGRLTIRNVGIDNRSAAELTFWVSDQSEWSSFSKEWATKKGASAAPIRVPVVRFSDLLNDYPQALFVKIDIEGNDVDCVRELHECKFPPAYLSFERGKGDREPEIQSLVKLGYDAFKFVRQNDWLEINCENMRHLNLRRLTTQYAYIAYQRIPRVLRARIRSARRAFESRKPQYKSFAPGSSGPMPGELPGPWMTAAELLTVMNSRRALDRRLDDRGPTEWFDIHARHSGAGPGLA